MILANYAWTMCVYTLPHESKIEAKPEHIYTFKTAPELDPLQYVNRALLNAPWLIKTTCLLQSHFNIPIMTNIDSF
jgi:hypothetical protein